MPPLIAKYDHAFHQIAMSSLILDYPLTKSKQGCSLKGKSGLPWIVKLH